MADSSASRVDSSRIHRLLRSLVGVADVSLIVTPEGKLRSVAVLRDGNVQEHQLVRNVISGLKAGFGLRLEPSDVQVVLHVDAWRQRFPAQAEAERPAAPPAPSVPAKPTVTRLDDGGAAYTNGNGIHSNGNGNHSNGNGHHSNGNGNGNGNGASRLHGNGNGNGVSRVHANGNGAGNSRLHPARMQIAPSAPAAAQPRPAVEPVRAAAVDPFEPRLELVDIERHGAVLRCRVSVRVGERTFTGIAEVRDAPTAEAELVARVTLDALRGGGLTTARLDGVSLTTIADMVYVVAAVRTAPAAVPRASAAPLLRDMANAAAVAVLRAHGPIGTAEPRAALNGTI